MEYMPIGVFINCAAVFLGGLVGASVGGAIPERVRTTLSLIFGVASMAMGIAYIVKMAVLPAVIFSVILGTAIGELVFLEQGIATGIGKLKGPLSKFFNTEGKGGMTGGEFMDKFIAIVVLFCASGTGIFGALESGMTGDHTTLITKSILDFFTAMIFAINLGYMVSLIFVPQLIFFLLLFFSAGFIIPLTTPQLLGDFTATGGILMLATGLRISGIKSFPIANMLPAMALIMPISSLWVNVIVPMLK